MVNILNKLPLLIGLTGVCYSYCPKCTAFQTTIFSSFLIGETSTSSAVVEYDELDSYLASKYSSNLSLSSSGRLSDMPTTKYQDGYNQWDESVYVKNVGTSSYSEGNCGLVSMSNIMAYYSRYGGKTSFPAYGDSTAVYPYSLPQYLNYFSSYGYVPKSTVVNLHSIYSTMRDFVWDLGYRFGGMNDSNTASSFSSACAYYGYTASYTPYSEYTFGRSDIMNEIDNGRPIQLRVLGDSVYGSHGMMITGYKMYNGYYIYPYGMGVSVIIFCVSVLDSWSSNERWYDLEQVCDYPYPSGLHRSEATTIAKVSIS